MIAAIGIDSVDIARCAQWHHYTQAQLLHLFTLNEYVYCLETPNKSAERFAVRFAAKEAFYKAWCSMHTHYERPFFAVCNTIEVSHRKGRPVLHIAWQELIGNTPHTISDLRIHCSLTHTRNTATACAIIEIP